VKTLTQLILALAAALPLAAADPTDDAVRSGLEKFLSGAEREGYSGAVLVSRGGKVLLEKGYGFADVGKSNPVRADTVFTTGSITKQFTAAAALKLEMLGQLAVEDRMAKYLPGVPKDKEAITLHQLLTHTAGFPGAIGDDVERIGRDDFVKQALATPLLSPPGERYEYSNVGFSLLAAIVERVSGQGYEDFLAQHLFAPAGMKDTGYHRPKWEAARLAHGTTQDGKDWGTQVDRMFSGGGPGWHLLGNGGILSTVGDMHRWHRALLTDTVLDAKAKAKMYTPFADEGGGTHYGYGWSIEKTPYGRLVTHNGGNPFFFSDFLRYLDRNVVIYYSTNSTERRMRRLARRLAQIVFTGTVPALPEKPAPTLTRIEGLPAAPGSAAARWGLPGTAEAEACARFFDTAAQKDASVRRQAIPTVFAPAAVERRGLEGLAELLERLHNDLVGMAVQGFEVRPGEGPDRPEAHLTLRSQAVPESIRLVLFLVPSGSGSFLVGALRAEIGN
jgi:CubicO group peptidase (beta-lactamase class C family)